MKKILYSIMALAIAAMTFTACEDVPAPYDTPTPGGGGGGETEVTYEGSGTQESPYTCADAINYAKSFGQAESEVQVYIKGYITKITEEFSTQYGNATFEMSDTKEGSNKFTFYRGLYLGNKKFANGNTQIKVGDEVIVYGKVVNYRGNTPETVQGSAFLYSLNGVNEGGAGNDTPVGEAKGTGSLDDPFNAAAAIAYAKSVGDTESDRDVYIKGKVSSIKEQYGTQYGNATFGISDDGTTTGEFTIYRALYLGNQKYTAGDLLQEKDEVIVYGKVTCFKGNTPETVQGKAYLYSLNGKTESEGGETPTPPTPTPTGDNLLANGDFETWSGGQPTNWKSATTASSATLSQSTEAHGGSYAVKVTHDANANKRMAYQEITLKAGTYTMAFYVKASSGTCSVRPGFTDVKDGKANTNYSYGDYVNDITTEWQQVVHSFTLSSETTLNILVMVPKNSGSDPIIDDFVLSTSDGGLADGGNDTPGGGDTPSDGVKTVTVAEFNAAAESTNVWYQLTGTVTHLEDGTYKNSTTYGNFDLVDSTGSVYVYGVVTEKGASKGKFADLMKEKGIKDGSTITIIGNRGSYNGKIEVTNAYFVSVSVSN